MRCEGDVINERLHITLYSYERFNLKPKSAKVSFWVANGLKLFVIVSQAAMTERIL